MQVRLRNIFEIQQSAQESRQSSRRQKHKRRTSRSGDLLLCFGHLFITFRAHFYLLKIQCMTISGGVASHSSAAHPAVINRMPSSDNASQEADSCPLVPRGVHLVARVLSALHGQDVQVLLKNRGKAQCCWNSELVFKQCLWPNPWCKSSWALT